MRKKYNKQIKRNCESLEDLTLGYLAKEREKNSKKSDYIPIEQALKRREGEGDSP